MATSHPHAVRALEKSVGKKCEAETIIRHAKEVIIACGVDYVKKGVYSGGCTINTKFDVDHTEINQLIASDDEWELGKVKEGEEFLVFLLLK